MKRNKMFAGVMALAVTAVSVCSLMNASNAKAAEVADKPNLDFVIEGNYTEKKISKADADIINKAFGYDSGDNTVSICAADATGYINWDNSSLDSWKVLQTEVFQPVITRDSNGNLIVETDEDGEVKQAWSNWATYRTEKADEINHKSSRIWFEGGGNYDKTESELNNAYYSEGKFYAAEAITDAWVRPGYTFTDYVLSENHFCLSNDCHKNMTTINSHLGITQLTDWKPLSSEQQVASGKFYESENVQINDAYIIRILYTADDVPLNWMHRDFLAGMMHLGVFYETMTDVHGKVFATDIDYYAAFEKLPEATEDRRFRYSDFWILPEGVETVLNLEDVEENETPGETVSPSESYVVDFSKADSQTVSKEDFAAVLEANKENDVVIKSNNGVTFTFAKGTMTQVDGKDTYDFSTSINNTYDAGMPSYIQKNSFVSQINFNYSGKLPAKASIRFYAGIEYAGQTLYYSLMNEDNTFAYVDSYVVDSEGYITVKQDHCSSYVLTTTKLQAEGESDNETQTPTAGSGSSNETQAPTTGSSNGGGTQAPDTGDTSAVYFAAMLLILSAGVFAVSTKKSV